MTGKRLGSTTITARYAGKKYKCRVSVKSNIDADKITIKYANDVFTKAVYQQVKKVHSLNTEGVYVTDSAAIKKIYSELASWQLIKSTEPEQSQSLKPVGGLCFELILKSGRKIVVSCSDMLIIEDVRYEYPVMKENIRELIVENREY